jgi:hypothetical protein
MTVEPVIVMVRNDPSSSTTIMNTLNSPIPIQSFITIMTSKYSLKATTQFPSCINKALKTAV